MKRGVLISGVILLLAAGGYTVYAAQTGAPLPRVPGLNAPAPTSAAPLLAEDRPVRAATEIVAEAVVVPVQYAALSLAAEGKVAEILVAEGAELHAGDVIARLETDREVIAVAQAQSAVDKARAYYDLLVNGARPEELAAAQAAVDAAQAQLDILQQGAREEDIAGAEAALAAAQAGYATVDAGADDQDLIAAQAEMANARAQLEVAQRAYDKISWRNDVAASFESGELQRATNEFAAAEARYNDLLAGAEPSMLAEASALVDQARAQLERLQAPPTEAEIAAAAAAVRQAQAQLDLIAAGSRPEDIAAALADLSNAETLLMQAQITLADRELRAPFDGVLASLDLRLGQQVTATFPVAYLADTSAWLVETTDLTELDVVHVPVGASVLVEVDALPDLELTGTVTGVKPFGVNVLGDITYKATIRLEQSDPRLLWNMTAAVTIEP